MGITTNISWTDRTWNPFHGCHKVSEGCRNCYMFRDKERYGQEPNKVLRSKSTFNDPLKWKESSKVFTCSWSDFFIEEADEWRDEAWAIIKRTPHLTYQILTKRPENIADRLPLNWGFGYENVWLGTSIENEANKGRLSVLQSLKNFRSKFKTFVSAEPLLSAIDFETEVVLSTDFAYLDWLIIGGESGNLNGKYKYRPCELEWIEDLVNQAKAVDVAIWVKQVGSHLAKDLGYNHPHGANINEFPEYLRIQEFPK